MKKYLFIAWFIFISDFLPAQNFPACDSLVIDCCAVDSMAPNTITLTVTNFSSVLFDYPGFVLFDNNMDTIAIETVNYFGIGTFPQVHTLSIVAPFTLPFTGYLNLYTLFYDTLACNFQVNIPDTSTGLMMPPFSANKILVYPNPSTDNEIITVEFADKSLNDEVEVELVDSRGSSIVKGLFVKPYEKEFKIPIQHVAPGFYVMNFRMKAFIFRQKLIINHSPY